MNRKLMTCGGPLTLVCVGATLASALLLVNGAGAFPTGANPTQGSVTVGAPAGNTMTINQTSQRGVVQWTDFSIGAGQTVRIVQPSSSSALLNRVVGEVPSNIAGNLIANGQVFIVNPQGIIFSGTAVVNVGALVASSIDVNSVTGEADFMNGINRFNGTSTGAPVTVNAGAQLTAGGTSPETNLADRGTIALLGGQVNNDGTVTARLGTVAMAAGGDITLDFAGDGLTTVVINAGSRTPILENSGTLAADGGLVSMSAQAAIGLAALTVNQTGVLRAQSLVQRNGHIMLDAGSAGTASVSGTFDASGAAGLTGGRIDITGQQVAVQSPVTLDAEGAAGGGNINVGIGPSAALNAPQRTANAVWVGPDTVISANATDKGNGGSVALQAGSSVQAFGLLSAQGGPNGGNGGSLTTAAYVVDTSAATIALAAPAGTGGLWLLDTGSLIVGSFGASESDGPFTPTAGTGVSQVNASQVNSVLNQGASVTLRADAAYEASGTVVVQQSISKTAGGDATLTLAAARGLTINPFPDNYLQPDANITSTAGKLNLVLQGGGSGVQGGDIVIGGTSRAPQLLTNGGDVSMGEAGGQSGTFDGDAIVLTNTTIDTRVGAAANAAQDSAPSGAVTLAGAGAAGILLSGTKITTSTGPISLQVSSNAADNPSCDGVCQVGGITIGNGFYAPPLPPGNDTVGFVEQSALRTTSGAIQLFGQANDTGLEPRQGEGSVNPPVNGVYVYQGSTVHTDTGNIDIRGFWTNQTPGGITPATPFPSEYGVALDNAAITSNSGQISLSAQGGTASAMYLNAATIGAAAATGDIVLRAANSQSAAGAAATSIQFGAALNTIASKGALNAHPGGVGSDFSLSAADTTPITLFGTAPGMSFTAAQLAQFQGFRDVVFGSDTQTGKITVAGLLQLPGVGNVTLANPGTGSYGIDLQQGAALGGNTLTLASAGPVTSEGPILAGALLLSGPSAFSLTNPLNNVGMLSSDAAGSVDYANAGALVIAPVSGVNFHSASNQRFTVGGGNASAIGNFRATALTRGIQIGGTLSASTPDALQPGGSSALAGTPFSGTPVLQFATTPSGAGNSDVVGHALVSGVFNLSSGGTIDLIMPNGVFTNVGNSNLSATNAWRVWASTWVGETRGTLSPGNSMPNFYGCTYSGGCSWGGVVPAGNHFVYAARPTVIVTGGNATRLAGAPNPTFTYTASGLVNGDTPGVVLIGSISTTATQGSPVGKYAIDPNFLSGLGYVVIDEPGVLTVLPTVDPLGASGLQGLFSAAEQTFVYENNLQGTNICVGSNQPLFTTAPPGETEDLLAVEWKRVRSQPNLNSCMVLNGQHGCGDF